jgi:hypothetical protein
MKETLRYLLASVCLAAALTCGDAVLAAGTNAPAGAKTAAPAGETTEKPKAKRDWYPFGGTVAAVDPQARTVSLKKKKGERVLQVDAKSELQVNGKPAALVNVKVGDYAHGKLHKDGSGKEVITAAKFDKEKAKP